MKPFKAICIATLFFCCMTSVFGSQNHLKEFSIEEARCKIAFPTKPQHLKQRASFFDANKSYEYDVYISSLDMKTFYYLFATKFHSEPNSGIEIKALEGFLNGLLNAPQNKLLSSEIVEKEDKVYLDFFIESDQRYFKGRALMAEGKFFLIAMDTEDGEIDQNSYQSFIDSFILVK